MLPFISWLPLYHLPALWGCNTRYTPETKAARWRINFEKCGFEIYLNLDLNVTWNLYAAQGRRPRWYDWVRACDGKKEVTISLIISVFFAFLAMHSDFLTQPPLRRQICNPPTPSPSLELNHSKKIYSDNPRLQAVRARQRSITAYCAAVFVDCAADCPAACRCTGVSTFAQ